MKALRALLLLASLTAVAWASPLAAAAFQFEDIGSYEIAELPVGASLTGVCVIDLCVPSDARLDIGVAAWDGCASPAHANNGGSPVRDLPCGFSNHMVVQLFDLVAGTGVGGFICEDRNGDGVCQNAPFENWGAFCGGRWDAPFNSDTTTLVSLFVTPNNVVTDPLACGGLIGGTTGVVQLRMTFL